jgi:ubiquinone/menaquinone biosynthesis C-methylase UbiE
MKDEILQANIDVYNSEYCSLMGNEISESVQYIKEFYISHIRFMMQRLYPDNIEIMDFCCGTGATTTLFYPFLSDNSKVYAMDVSGNMLDCLKSKLGKSGLRKTIFIKDDANVYFRNNPKQYDIICVSGALHHLSNCYDVIDICCQRIKPQGFFYIVLEPKGIKKGFLFNFLTKLDSDIFVFLTRYKKKESEIKDKVAYDKYLADWKVSEYMDCLEYKKVNNIFSRNNMEIISNGDFPYYRYKLTFNIAKLFRCNEYFFIIGRKTR